MNQLGNTMPQHEKNADAADAKTLKQDRVGWRIATFALETLEPAPGIKLTATDIWHAYLHWCQEKDCVPLAMGIFTERFDDLARDAGLVRWQNGAHVLYRDTTLRKA